MEYRGIFITAVILSLLPEVFHNGYYYLRCGMSWRQSLQKDKDTICAHEQCLYVSRKTDGYFYAVMIGVRFPILGMVFIGFLSERLQQPIIIVLTFVLLLFVWLLYCQVVCQLCVVTSEHIFIRCLATLYKLKKIDIKNVSRYEHVLIPTGSLYSYYVDRIHTDGAVFRLTLIRDNALVSVLKQVVPKETLEQNRIAAKKYDDTIGKKVGITFLAVLLGIPLLYLVIALVFFR